ncbi:MAG: ribbon-helix-helix protein, CopG family [Ruminococcaceae bacterium]|nr:ribbon-helix-helix protein, CopG family [Oscillospiraceae bacterium]
MSRQRKILISVPDSLLTEVDDFASSRNINRSEFIRDAMRLYIKERKKAELCSRLRRGYEEMAEINLDIAELCVSADEEQQKSYEAKLLECDCK